MNSRFVHSPLATRLIGPLTIRLHVVVRWCRRNRLKLLIFCMSGVAALLTAECLLRLFTSLPITPTSNMIEDAELGWRVDPGFPEIDAAGFRNPIVKASADIVTVGDSHTFGLNASSDSAWPNVLAESTGMSVYNFGVSGYGILQYQHLFSKAMAMRPRHVVIGLYLSNDLNDVVEHASRNSYWRNELRHLFDDDELQSVQDSLRRRQPASLGAIVRNYSAVGYLLSTAKGKIWPADRPAINILHPRSPTVISYACMRAHRNNMDLGRTEIKKSYELLRLFLQRANKECRDQNATLTVLLTPSKELVYHRHQLSEHRTLPAVYEELVYNEQTLVKELKKYFTEQGIHFADAYPSVELALQSESNVYPSHDDGHPNAIGYRAYVDALLNSPGFRSVTQH